MDKCYLHVLSERHAYFARSARNYRDNAGVGDAYIGKHRLFTNLQWAEDRAYRMRKAIECQQIAADAFAQRARIMGIFE